MGPSRSVEDILTIITVQMSLVVVLNVPDHQETGRAKFFNAMSQARKTEARHRATDCIPRCRGTERPVAEGSRIASTLQRRRLW